jgi:hypothetical protein
MRGVAVPRQQTTNVAAMIALQESSGDVSGVIMNKLRVAQ